MHSFRSAVSKIFPLLFALIWAFPKADEPGSSHSGNSLDDIVAQLLRAFPTRLRENSDFIDSHKGALTQGLSQCLSAEYPRKNVLIYHDQNAKFDGTNAIHRSIELPSEGGTPGQHTYEIQIFDSGTFTLASDDGYHNWAFVGNWSQSLNVVKFYPLEESLAMYRSGRTGAKLGGGYLPPSRNTSNLESRQSWSSSSSGPWTITDDGSSSGAATDPNDPAWHTDDDEWNAFINGDPFPNDSSGYDSEDEESDEQEIEEELSEDGDSAGEDMIITTSQTWSADGELIAESSSLGPEAIAAVVVVAVIATVSALLVDVLKSLSNRNANERTFTQSTAAQLTGALSDKNAIVFHNQDSSLDFVGWTHTHHEMSLHNIFDMTVGYEIYSFDYGNFTLAGDGGYENWAFSGNWYMEEGSATVQFLPRQNFAECIQMARGLNSDTPLRLRQLVPPQIPTRQHVDTTHGYYLVNCVKPDQTVALGVAYYRDMEAQGGNIGQLPDDFMEVHNNHAGIKAWQGEGSILFTTTGLSFHWSFMHQDETDNHMIVGIAQTSTEQLWLYKDTKKLLYNSTIGWACSSLYYAF